MTSSQPNILLITTDHQRFDTIGAHGFDHMMTPHLDKLCDTSFNFLNHFSQSPVCVPSRTSIATGRYPHQTGAVWNFSAFPSQIPSIFSQLKESGYTTACIGKHHLININEPDHFDWVIGNGAKWALGCPEFRQHLEENNLSAEKFWEGDEFGENLGALTSDRADDLYIDGWLAQQALEKIKTLPEPFCLWLGFYGPHHPYDPPKRFREMYLDKTLPKPATHSDEWNTKGPLYRIYQGHKEHKFKQKQWPEFTEERLHKMRAHFYGEISFIDEQIGKVLNELDNLKLSDHTNIAFTSDHGDSLGDHNLVTKGPFLYEELIHVPMIVKTAASQGERLNKLTESIDIFSTFLEWSGRQPQDRSNSIPLDANSPERGAILAQTVTQMCYRTQTEKLIHTRGTKHSEFYDLTNDPHELHNLSKQETARVDSLKQKLFEHIDQLGFGTQQTWAMKKSIDPLTNEELEWEFTF